MFLVVAWLFATAAGPDYYEPLAEHHRPICWASLSCSASRCRVCYHLLNGLRHLFWDAGAGFNPKQASFVSGLILVLVGRRLASRSGCCWASSPASIRST